MADQSIALMGQQPQINAASSMDAVARLQQAQQQLQQGQQTLMSGASNLDTQLVQKVVAQSGNDPDAFNSGMQQAASQGSQTAAEYLRDPTPLAMRRLQMAHSGATLQGGRAVAAGQGADGAMQGGDVGANENITQSYPFQQHWGGMTPEAQDKAGEGFKRTLQMLNSGQVRDQASYDRMIDTLKAEGHPEAEKLRGQFDVKANLLPLINRFQQLSDFADAQKARETTGTPYVTPPVPTKVIMSGLMREPVVQNLMTNEFSYPDVKGHPLSGDLSDPKYHSYIDSMANYTAQLPSPRSPNRQQVIADIMTVNPKFSEANYDINRRTVNDYINGPAGRTVKSLNTSIDHIDTARNLVGALQNGDFRSANELGQIFGKEFGGTAATNFDTARDIVMDEVAKAVIGGQNAEGDRQRLQNNASRAGSPEQLKGVLDTLQELMAGQMRSQRRAYDATGLTDFNDKFLGPRAREVLDQYDPANRNQSRQSGGPAGGGGPLPLPSDHTQIQPGKIYNVPNFGPGILQVTPDGKRQFVRPPQQAAQPAAASPAPQPASNEIPLPHPPGFGGGQGEGMSVNPPNAAAIRAADEASARGTLQGVANRTGATISNFSDQANPVGPRSAGNIAPAALVQPRAYAAGQPNTPLARSPSLLDIPSDQLVSAGRQGPAPNTNFATDLQPIENTRQAIATQGQNAQRQQFAKIMGPQGTSDKEIERTATRNILSRRLMSARSPAARAEILRQMAANEDFSLPDMGIAAEAR